MPELTKLDHFAISVKDLNKSVDWYKSILKLKPLEDPGWGPEPIFLLAQNNSGVAIFSNHRGSPLEKNAGLPHFAFAADRKNYNEFKEHLSKNKIDWVEQNHNISESIYFRDPDDYKIEITTYDI